MDGGGHDVGVRDGVGVQAGGDEPGEVGHVHPQGGADLVGDGAEGGEVEVAGVGGPAGDDDRGALAQGGLAHLVHLDAHGGLVHAVGGGVVVLAGEVDLHAVGEVSAVGQGQAQEGVAGGGQGVEDGGVGLGPGVGLDIGPLGVEDGLGALDGQGLGDVDDLAASVVAATWVALRVLVGQDRALTLQDGPGNEVLRGDHLQGLALAGELTGEDLGDVRVELGQRLVQGRGDGLRGHVSPQVWGARRGEAGGVRALVGDPWPRRATPESCSCRSPVVIHPAPVATGTPYRAGAEPCRPRVSPRRLWVGLAPPGRTLSPPGSPARTSRPGRRRHRSRPGPGPSPLAAGGSG